MNNDFLISKNFFPKTLDIDISKIYPVSVIGTMSSGKTTLINSLFDMDVFPTSNYACTEKVFSILDDDNIIEPQMYVTYQNNRTKMNNSNFELLLKDINNNDDIKNVLITSNIKGILNTNKSLLVIDTPGPNNSLDNKHHSITENTLEMLQGGLILYVMNVTQMGIDDDMKLLSLLKKSKCFDKCRILFILNKVDELDIEKDSINDIVKNAWAFLLNNGIKNPEIIPVSALATNLFKKVLRNEKLTRKEYRSFEYLYSIFKPNDLRMTSFGITYDLKNQDKFIELENEQYYVSDLKAAIDNTGITYLEKYIQNSQIIGGNFQNIIINKKISKKSVFTVIYDPYDVKCVFKKNGKTVDFNSKFGKKMRYRLQDILYSSSDWDGLIEEIIKEFDDDNIIIHFKGREKDFNDLKYCVNSYKGEIKLELTRI